MCYAIIWISILQYIHAMPLHVHYYQNIYQHMFSLCMQLHVINILVLLYAMQFLIHFFLCLLTAPCRQPDQAYCNQPLPGNTSSTFSPRDCTVNPLVCPGLCGLCTGNPPMWYIYTYYRKNFMSHTCKLYWAGFSYSWENSLMYWICVSLR